MHPVTEYATKVVYGELNHLCGPLEIMACKRHLDDLEKSKSDDYPFVFDHARADRIIKYFRIARQLHGAFAGLPFELLDWQIFDFGSVYGWVKKRTGQRRFNTAYIAESRGSAKSACLSVCGCYAMTSDCYWVPGKPEDKIYQSNPEVVCCAVDRGQANIVWGDIRQIALNSPDILKSLIIKTHSIRHKSRGGQVLKLSRDTTNKSGGRPDFIVTDEYHEHQTSEVRDIVSAGKGKKAQALEFIITTAGEDAGNKPCFREDEFAQKILRGEVVQDDYFVMIRRPPDDFNPHDKKYWYMCSPMLRSKNEYSTTLMETTQSEYDKAYGSGDPDKIRKFLIQRMNVWQVDAENKYFSGCLDKWQKSAVSREEFAKLTKNAKCWIGFDLGKTTDLSGTGFVAYIESINKWAFKINAFMPQDRAAEHEKSDRVPYLAWAKDGYCTLTPGAVTDYNYVETWIYDSETDNEWTIQEIGYDGHNAVQLAQNLAAVYGPERVLEIRQTCSGQNAAVKRFREIVLQEQCIHEENPIFDWCLKNAVEVRDNYGDIKLSKRTKNDTQRIDPVQAIMNGLARAIVHQPEKNLDEIILSEDWSL